MDRTHFDTMECPIARTLEHVGEWWTILVLREVFDGYSRFEDIQHNLGIAPTTLTKRLNALVGSGLLERRRYLDHPPRSDYVLTDAGRAIRPVVLSLYAWGDAHLTSDGRRLVLVDTVTGRDAEPLLVDRVTGVPLDDERFAFAAGPAASATMAARIAGTAARRAAQRDAQQDAQQDAQRDDTRSRTTKDAS